MLCSELRRPKSAATPYIAFATQQRPIIQCDNPQMGPIGIMKELGTRWKNFSDGEKAAYASLASEDQARWEQETAAWQAASLDARISQARAALAELEAQRAGLAPFDDFDAAACGTAAAGMADSADGQAGAKRRRLGAGPGSNSSSSGGGGGGGGSSGVVGCVGGEVKLLIVVRTDLKMSKGKIAAQASHAAVGAVHVDGLGPTNCDAGALLAWERSGSKTVCTKVGSAAELAAVVRAARRAGLPVTEVADAGRTQVAAGSRTCAAFGPAGAGAIDAVTSGLKLL